MLKMTYTSTVYTFNDFNPPLRSKPALKKKSVHYIGIVQVSVTVLLNEKCLQKSNFHFSTPLAVTVEQSKIQKVSPKN